MPRTRLSALRHGSSRYSIDTSGDQYRTCVRRGRPGDDAADVCASALDARPLTAYAVSLELFPRAEDDGARRFAVAETLAHLERLAEVGRAARRFSGRNATYTEP
jgi:hypothetical protein